MICIVYYNTDHFKHFILQNDIKYYFFPSTSCLSPNSSGDQIFTETYEVKHILEVPKVTAKNCSRFLPNKMCKIKSVC